MNNARRKRVTAISEQVLNLRAELADECAAEQEAFDALPEALQDGERGQALQQAAEALEAALDHLDEAMNSIEEAAA